MHVIHNRTGRIKDRLIVHNTRGITLRQSPRQPMICSYCLCIRVWLVAVSSSFFPTTTIKSIRCRLCSHCFIIWVSFSLYIIGYNASLFAYGQTGSGKSFSMMGPKSMPGLIPKGCAEIFERIKTKVGREWYTYAYTIHYRVCLHVKSFIYTSFSCIPL